MLRTLSAIFILVLCGLLEAQQVSVPSQPKPTDVQVSEGPGTAFQFTKVDNDLLAEVDDLDVQYEKKGLVLHDADLQAFIDAVGYRVLGNRPVPEKVTYRFLVLKATEVNAFGMPNGTVYITTGLLALLENEAQLAAILGHETAHVYERHPYLENRSQRKKTVASNLIGLAAAAVPGGYAALLTNVAANTSQMLLFASIYGYSREKESEADHDGIAAMTVAGYDPHAMAVGFELMDQDSTLEYEPYHTLYHDHPDDKKRREEALAFADAHTPAGARTGLKQDYIRIAVPAMLWDINVDLESRRPRTAVARATRLVEAFPGDARYQLLLGESYRALGAKTAIPTTSELTPYGEDLERKQVLKMTEQQEQKALLNTLENHVTLKENQTKAETAFLAAIQSDPQYALTYRELGFLYQDESRFADAAVNYKRYLQLVANTSLDRLRIARRLAEVEKLQAAPSQ